MGVSENKVLRRDGKLPFLSAPVKIMQNLYNYRQLLKHFIGRDLKVRYHNSILGYGWSILEPLALTVTFYILFAILSDSEDPYRPLTILLGILAWSLFAKTFSNGTISIQRNSSLIQRVYFPREIFMFSKSGFNLAQFSLSLLVIIPLLVHYQLAPLDNFGLDGKGSWWIGENGDFSTRELLANVVQMSKELLDSSDDVILCIYGSSMGGYGAILNGTKLGATAVYANVPQIKLLGSTYSELGMKKYFEAALGLIPNETYNDLNNFVKTLKGELPLFLICENRFGQRDYREQQAMSFISTLNEMKVNYHLEIVPTSGHNKNLGLREVRALFEKFIPELSQLKEE